MLRRWGNLSTITLSSPAPISELVQLALLTPASGWSEADGNPSEIGRSVAALLTDKSEMLEEYVSIIVRDGKLIAIPQLIDG